MTIAEKTTSARNDYIGNGVNTNFSFTFEVLNEANSLTGKNYSLKVLLTTSGVEAEQVEDTDYTVTYDSSTRLGSITFTTAPASGVLITLLSDISLSQSTDYINIGTDKFPADSHEGTVDKLTLIARELQEQIDRSILLPESSTLSNVTIPVSSENASKFITVNAAGDDLTASEIADTVGSPVSTFMKTVLDDETAAAARTTLGAQANIITTRGDIIRGSSTGVAERLALGSANQILKSNGTDISWSDFDKASTLLRGLSILPKRITISNGTDADHDIDSTAGNFIFADGSGQAVLNGITKKIDADFALGTAAGGMPATVNKTGTYATTGTAVTGTGTAFNTEFSVGDVLWSATKGEGRRITAIGGATSMTLASAFSTDVSAGETVQKNGLAPDTTYHYVGLSTSDGSTTDAGFDTQPDGSNLLADSVVNGASLTKYKWIMAVITDGSANIIGFIQTGKLVEYKSLITEYSANLSTVIPTSFTDLVLTTPNGIRVKANLNLKNRTNSGISFEAYGLDKVSNQTKTLVLSSDGDDCNYTYIMTDTNSTIQHRGNVSNNAEYTLYLISWEIPDELF